MTRQSAADLVQLASVERELSRSRLRLRFANPTLEAAYTAEQRETARRHNRIAVSIMLGLFDIFLLPELRAIPEVVPLSLFLRFGVLTPLLAAYVLLDWRGRITRLLPGIVTALLIAPTAFALIESAFVVSPDALTNYQAVPLLQLGVLTCRLGLRQAALVNATSIALFVWTVLTASFVPPAVVPSLVLTDVAIGIGALLFAWRIDLRDRQVFLSARQGRLSREALHVQNRTLARLTQLDQLTGLANRRCFDETIAALWEAGAHNPAEVALILFDIDCFKQFNDALGHQAGDECLGAVARAVTRCLRDDGETLVRYGGEEFAIILPGASLEDGCIVAERVRLAIEERALPHPGGGPAKVVTVSLGVATVQAPRQSAASLVEAADQMLYLAKRHGRNRVECALPMTARVAEPERLATAAQVSDAGD